MGLLLALLFLCALVVWFWAWRSPGYYTDYTPVPLAVPVLPGAQYDSLVAHHARPYLVQVQAAEGALLLYGAEHTRDPNDPQLADIRARWAVFQPTVALVESRLGFLLPGLMDPVERYGEMGAVYALARRAGVPAYTWEPPRSLEIARMLEAFPAERVALFYVLRPYASNLRFGRPDDPDAILEGYRQERTRYPGLENTLHSVADIDRIWQRDFAGLPDWRDTSDEEGWPGYLGDLAAHSNTLRDEHFAQVIIDLVRRGQRVFAVCGSSHSVKLEKTLKAAL